MPWLGLIHLISTNYPVVLCYFLLCNRPNGPGPSRYRSCKITLRHTIVGRTPLDEWSARRRTLSWQHTKFITEKVSIVWDSKQQLRHVRRRRPTPSSSSSSCCSSSSSSSSICGAGGNPADRTSAFKAVCTLTPVLVSLFISIGAVRPTVWETSINERRNYGREMAGQI
jgi:hypothetical protein